MFASIEHRRADSCSSKRRRTSASGRGYRQGATLTLGGVGEASPHVVARQLGKLRHDLVLGHARREIAEDVTDGDPRATDTRLAEANGRIDGDPLEEIRDAGIAPVGCSMRGRAS